MVNAFEMGGNQEMSKDREPLFCDYLGEYNTVVMYICSEFYQGEKFKIDKFYDRYHSKNIPILDLDKCSKEDQEKIRKIDDLAEKANDILSNDSLTVDNKRDFINIALEVARICGSQTSQNEFKKYLDNLG